jgi:hypothetical protein
MEPGGRSGRHGRDVSSAMTHFRRPGITVRTSGVLEGISHSPASKPMLLGRLILLNRLLFGVHGAGEWSCRARLVLGVLRLLLGLLPRRGRSVTLRRLLGRWWGIVNRRRIGRRGRGRRRNSLGHIGDKLDVLQTRMRKKHVRSYSFKYI